MYQNVCIGIYLHQAEDTFFDIFFENFSSISSYPNLTIFTCFGEE